MAYGYIQKASDVAKYLKEFNKDYQGRKIWERLYNQVDLNAQNALSNVQYDYSTAMLEAYRSAYAQKSAIANSALGSGFKADNSMDIDASLQEAFNSYRQQYLNTTTEIKQNALEAEQAIDKELLSEAQNYVDYEASAYSYLQNLYDRAFPSENSNYDPDNNLVKLFNENSNWSKYLVKETDEAGNEVTRLMSEQELRARNYDLDEYGRGHINRAGIDFYDQMLNELSPEGKGHGFHEWLSKENPELYEWSQSDDVYNYTKAGTKLGTFKKMVGLKSTDDEYNFIENFAGLSKEDVQAEIAGFSSSVQNIINTGDDGDTESALKQYSSLLDNISDYITKLPLSDEQRDSIKANITSLREEIDNVDIKNTSSYYTWAETVEAWNDALAKRKDNYGEAVVDAVLAFAYGLLRDNPSLNPEFHFIGEETSRDVKAAERKTHNKELVDNISQEYLDLITYISSKVPR